MRLERIINMFFIAILAVLLGTAAWTAYSAINDPNGDGFDVKVQPSGETYVVHERPVTSVEMVVGLADMLVKADLRAKRLERERDEVLAEANRIIRGLVDEMKRRGLEQPTPALPDKEA